MISRRDSHDALHNLAERYGITSTYQAMGRRVIHAPDESIFAALRALGAEIDTHEQIREAVEERRIQEWSSMCDPTSVAWDGDATVEVRLPSRHSTTELQVELLLESGETIQGTLSVRDFKVSGAARFQRKSSFLARPVTLPWSVPPGYHQLELTCGELFSSVMIVSAPRKAFQHRKDRSWGTFLPLYSLRTNANWGAGNFGDLGRLLDWTGSHGGTFTGTLPLLPAFLDTPFLPGPYSPVSRLFWNEFFLDIPAIPEYSASSEAQSLVASSGFRAEINQLRASELVDYREGYRVRRAILEHLVEALLERGGNRREAFESWLSDHLHARLYAQFRAICERQQAGASGWSEAVAPAQVDAGHYDESSFNYHAYVQWIADRQLAALPRLPDADQGLYIDMPLGVHPDGYDVWREPDAFVHSFSVGAPPDLLGSDGQNWGFPPLHPKRLQEQGFRHFVEVVRHHMRHASFLRIDHLMGLHRQFWIPESGESRDGLYVQYPVEHLHAILSLESHCNQTELVGEDLGSVPPQVRPKMDEHAINRSIVVPFEVDEDSTTLDAIPEQSLATLDTHDMPPFAGIWNSWFDADRKAILLQLLNERDLITDSDEDNLEEIVTATLELLGTSDARFVLVNLEDLWLETKSQNIPGTTDDEHANWRRKASQSFEEFSTSDSVIAALTRLDAVRRRTTYEVREQ